MLFPLEIFSKNFLSNKQGKTSFLKEGAIIEEPEDQKNCDCDGETPLHVAAEKGYAGGQYNYGRMLYKEGVFQNLASSARWYRQAAEQGVAMAQYNLGFYYMRGIGLNKNDAQAVKWLRLAANQGVALAQNDLGTMIYRGQGALQNYAEAYGWYRLAAEQGLDYAQHNVANMYKNGEGLPQDDIRAHMWYNIASVNGDQKASKWRDETASNMTSADISEAQKMAKKCMDSNYKKCGW